MKILIVLTIHSARLGASLKTYHKSMSTSLPENLQGKLLKNFVKGTPIVI